MGRCLFAQTCTHPRTFPLLQHELELAVAAQVERIKLAKYAHLDYSHLCPLLLRHLECWERQLRNNVGELAHWLHGHRRTSQSRVPSAAHSHCNAEGKCAAAVLGTLGRPQLQSREWLFASCYIITIILTHLSLYYDTTWKHPSGTNTPCNAVRSVNTTDLPN